MADDHRTLSLYYFETCPYCVRVLDAMKELDLELPLKHILHEPEHGEELIREGGKDQVPCLKIEEHGGAVTWLYESLDIIEYLKQHVVS
jgi:glutathione S-transferase